jgi:hypothetical protein
MKFNFNLFHFVPFFVPHETLRPQPINRSDLPPPVPRSQHDNHLFLFYIRYLPLTTGFPLIVFYFATFIAASALKSIFNLFLAKFNNTWKMYQNLFITLSTFFKNLSEFDINSPKSIPKPLNKQRPISDDPSENLQQFDEFAEALMGMDDEDSYAGTNSHQSEQLHLQSRLLNNSVLSSNIDGTFYSNEYGDSDDDFFSDFHMSNLDELAQASEIISVHPIDSASNSGSVLGDAANSEASDAAKALFMFKLAANASTAKIENK